MVCLGNICRSPLAEGILKAKVRERGLGWQIDSAGTGAWHVGELPDHRSVEIAEQRGLDITDQRARQFSERDFSDFDLILVMDSNNYRDVIHMAPTEQDRQKVKMIMNYVEPGRNQNVPDPYWNDDGFAGVYDMLDEACERIIAAHTEPSLK